LAESSNKTKQNGSEGRSPGRGQSKPILQKFSKIKIPSGFFLTLVFSICKMLHDSLPGKAAQMGTEWSKQAPLGRACPTLVWECPRNSSTENVSIDRMQSDPGSLAPQRQVFSEGQGGSSVGDRNGVVDRLAGISAPDGMSIGFSSGIA
jgi:hypothetical protein